MANKDGLIIEIEAKLDIPQTVKNINKELKEIKKQIKKLQLEATLDKSKSKENIEKELAKLKNKEKELKIELKPQTETLKKQIKEVKKDSDIKLDFDTKSATDGINKFKNALYDTNTSTATLGATLKNALNNVGFYTSAYHILNYIKTTANEAKAAVEEYDKYTTNIKMITGVDDSKAQQMLSDYSDKAIELKVDVSDVAKANEVIYRAGKSLEESGQYLESSIKLAKVGFIDSDSAAENLVVIGNAYDLTADKLQGITDSLLWLDSNTNTKAGDLSKAVATAAKTSEMANIGYTRLASAISVIKNDTGKSENEAATALNRILSRAYNVKLNNYLKEAEAEGTSEEETKKSINDLEKILSTLDIQVRDSKKEFRDFTDIIDDLAPKFDKLSSVDQSAVTFALGGSQYKNTVKALIDDWDSVIELEEKATNAVGTTDEKYGAYLDSIEAKNATIQTSLKNLWNDVLPSEDLKNIKDATISVIEFTDKWQILQTIIRGATLFALAKGFISVKNGLSGTITNLSNFNTAMNITKTSSGLTATQINALGTACKGLSDKQLIAVLSSENLTNAQRLEALQAMGLSEAEATAKIETLGLSIAETTATTTTTSLKGAVAGLWATISANPLGLIITGITAVISVFSIYKQKQEEAAEAVRQAKEEQKQALEQAVNTANAEKDNIRDLISQYESFRDVTSLTADDKATLKTIQDKLIETFNLEAGAIDLVNGKYDEMIGKVKELSYQQLKQNENTLIAARQAAKDSYNSNAKNDFNITTSEKSGKKEDIYYNYILDVLEKMGLFTSEFDKNGKHLYLAKNLDSGQKVAHLGAALELFKSYDLTDTELFQWMTELQNYYQGEVDNLETATKNYAETVVDLFNYKNNISPDTLSASEYMEYVNSLLETIPDTEKDLQEAVKSVVDAMYKSPKINGDSALTNAIESETETFKETFEKYKDTVNDYLSEKSKIEAALKEQYENGYISIDTAFKLSDLGYNSAIVKDESGNYSILTDEIYKTVDAKNAEAVATLNLAKAEKVAALEAGITDYKLKLSKHIENGSTAMFYQRQIEQLQKDIQDTVNNYDMLISFYARPELKIDEKDLQKQAEQKAKEAKDIINNAFNDDKNKIDHLLAMDAITKADYYKQLNYLNNKYYKGQADFLDEYRKYEEEIYKYLKQQKLDAIDEEIDRLKTVNKEKQEEIDLEKKRQALENAKKQKNVKVFDSERGWIHETNREEVQKAQEDYDKAVTDKKVSDLQSVRKAIEKGVNVLHSDNEDTDIQSQVDNIQPILKNEKVINSVEELLNLFNIPYDASKFDNTWDEMLKDWSNPNKIFQSTFDNIINKTINNVNQNIKNQKAININIDKVVADNPQRFAEQMKKVMSDNFEGFYETYTDKFGKELKMWRMNHGYDN